MQTPIETDEREVSGFRFVINWYFDDDGDISWMGEFQSNDNGEEWLIDRQRDVLLGEWETGACFHCGKNTDTRIKDFWCCGNCYDDHEDYESEDFDVAPRKEYDTLVTSDYSRNSYRYWVPSSNHCPPNRNDVRPYEKYMQEWIDRLKVDSITEANIQCILEDHKIVEDLNKGLIWFEWYECTMYAGEIEIDSTSLSGILDIDEADRDTYFTEAIDGLLSNNKEEVQARITERELEIERLKKHL
jgi:hypothetical protein